MEDKNVAIWDDVPFDIRESERERWKHRKNVYTVKEVYLIERNGEPVDWYYDRAEANCDAYGMEQEDFYDEVEEG